MADGSVVILIEGDDSQFQSTLGKLENTAKTGMKAVGAAIGAVSVALAAAGGYAVKVGAEFETSLAKVGTIADTSVVSLSDLSSGIIDLSNKTGESAATLNEALYSAISAGADTAHATDLVAAAAKAAKGGFTDTETAVDGLTSALNAYGKQTTEAEGLANKFLVTQNLGKTTFGELASSIGTVAPTANAAGVSVDSLLASVASLTANGIGTSEAMTGMKAALSNIIKPTSDAAKVAQQLGIDFSTAALQSKGWSGFLQDIKDKTGGNTDQMAALFGSVEALNTILTLTSDQGMELMSETLGEMQTNTTALEDAYTTMTSTFEGSTAKLKANLDNLAIAIYEGLKEPLTGAADAALGMVQTLQEAFNAGGLDGLVVAAGTVLAQAMSALVQGAPQVVDAAISLLGSFGQGLADNAGAIAGGAWQIVECVATAIISQAPALFQAATGLLGQLADGLTANLPTLIPAALEMLNSLTAGLRENVGQLVDAGLSIITAIAQGIIASIPALIANIPEIVINIAGCINDNAAKLIGTAASLLAQLGIGLIQAIPNLIANIPQIIQAVVAAFFAFNWISLGQKAVQAIANGIQAMAGNAQQAAGQVVTKVTTKIGELVGNLLTKGRGAITNLANGIRNGISGVLSTAGQIVTTITTKLGQLPGELLNLGKQMIQGLINGIKSKVKEVGQAITGLASSVLDKAKSFFKIASPSRVMRDAVGLMLTKGLAVGILQGKRQALDAQEAVCNALLNQAKAGVDTLNKEIARIQEAAQRRQAAKELSNYEKSVQEKYKALEKRELEHQEKLAKAKQSERAKLESDYLEDREKILAEIAKLDADWEEKQVKAREQAQQEALKASITALEKLQGEYEKARDNISRDVDSMAGKLAGYGELFTIDSKTGKLSLEDLNKNLEAVHRYQEALESLREKGASADFLAEITSLGAEEGLKFAEALDNLGDQQLDDYMGTWEEVQRESRQVAETFYEDQLSALDESFAGQLEQQLSTVPVTMGGVGKDAIQGLIEGMQSKSGPLMKAAEAIVRQAINAMKAAADVRSPSGKTRDLVGAPMGEGVGVGFQKALPLAMKKARAAVELETSRLSAVAATRANAGAMQNAAPPVRTYYQRERIENTPVVRFEGELAALGRLLHPYIEMERKRKGSNLVKGGTI